MAKEKPEENEEITESFLNDRILRKYFKKSLDILLAIIY